MIGVRLHCLANLCRRSASIAAVVVCMAVGIGDRTAVKAQGIPPMPAGGHAAPAAAPTFQSMAAAARSQDFTAVQVRRFRGEDGTVTAVREQVQVRGAVAAASGATATGFAVTFLGVEGELPGSPLTQKWQMTYARFGALFHQYSSFRVRDEAKALANYSLHDFGPVSRAGRSARRAVVFPVSVDKSIWVIDVDDVTQIPLYSAEFDLQMRLMSEVEAVSFTPSVGALTGGGALAGLLFTDFVSARAHLGVRAGIVDPDLTLVREYSNDRIEVRTDPLNGRQKLIMSFTDGIDLVLITQSPGSPDPFAGMPSKNAQGGGHTIARYRDPTLSVLMFWDKGVSFQVAGSGGLRRLDEVARRIYVQALTN